MFETVPNSKEKEALVVQFCAEFENTIELDSKSGNKS